ncbi:hypothetical protein BBB57_14775 [Kosakonia sacchari]|uniref:type III secretion system stator protein SctL n=1 Tax=Kosakonia sacchari TaxID=1158459 RepID=UPI00080736BE|nr:type III secretion system stator protein SctL [Kosakonia sacchari]ANR79419.1 hypothetical protein BBB57_14775 [Kosakonia sacchari]
MLTMHKISPLAGISLVRQPVIRKEDVANFCLSDAVMDNAHFRAGEVIKQAQLTAEQLRQQAYEEVSTALWAQARVILDDWEKEREEMRRCTVDVAKALLAQALELAFAKKPGKARLEALLNQLKKHTETSIAARLFVNPRQYAQAADYLAQHTDLRWSLVSDSQQAKDEVCLKSTHGSFTLSWQTFSESFITAINASVPSNDQQIDKTMK